MTFESFLEEQGRMNADGTLTVGSAMINRFYRLLGGNHAYRVIIKTCAKIDGEPVVFFADSLTWVFADSLKDVPCEVVYATFSK